MTDRRRNPRFLLRTPLEGRLRVTREVLLERYDAEELVVLSPEAAAHDEVLQMNDVLFRPPLGVDVVVKGSAPVMVDGSMQHRLSLRTSPNGIHRADIVGSLMREVRVRVRDICRAGCLLESEAVLPPDAQGELVLIVDGHLSSAMVRITRCQRLPGRGRACYLGAVFEGRGMRGLSLPAAVDRFAGEQEWSEEAGSAASPAKG